MRRNLANIYRLGIKELWSFWRDPAMLILIVYVFTFGIYVAATAMPETLSMASVAIVDEDSSSLSARISSVFYPPHFTLPDIIGLADVDQALDVGRYTFVLDIPPNFERDLLAGNAPAIQLNVDATRMTQAFSGSGYIQQMVMAEIDEFNKGYREVAVAPVDLNLRIRFNPGLQSAWFGALSEAINYITMLALILTGAALIREREHGTIEHLLAMPVTPAQIMLSKIWSMSLVVLVASALALELVVRGLLHVPIAGSLSLFLVGAALHLFAMPSMAVFVAAFARNMPQFALMMVLILMPLQLLSGGMTPTESMPFIVRNIMLLAPTTHFTQLAQAILFRGAGIDVVWPQCVLLLVMGFVLFMLALARFRKTIGQMA